MLHGCFQLILSELCNRAKYCTRTGCVVARMDHYCVWLNATVGYGNHRTFMLFLLSHLFMAGAAAAMVGRWVQRHPFH